jgi:hypothetical protein
LIAQADSAFNRRAIDGALALMSENVSWPKASEGGRAVGKEEIRSYWTRQWKEFDPHVEPLEVIDEEGGITQVKVHQRVKSLGGDVLSDSEVWHFYTIANGLIERMEPQEKRNKPGPNPIRGILQTLAGVWHLSLLRDRGTPCRPAFPFPLAFSPSPGNTSNYQKFRGDGKAAKPNAIGLAALPRRRPCDYLRRLLGGLPLVMLLVVNLFAGAILPFVDVLPLLRR